MRSAQPSPVRTNWRTGSASKNSLAMRRRGPAAAPRRGRARLPRRRRAPPAAPRAGAGWSRPDAPAPPRRNAGRMRAVRRMSAISVPRPGPSSARTKGAGAPIRSQAATAQSADQLAEHLADLRRGDEVAAAAERLAAHVVAELGVAEAGGHVVGDGDRPVGGSAESAPRGARRLLGGAGVDALARHVAACGALSARRAARETRSAADAGERSSGSEGACPWSGRRRGSRSGCRARGRTRRRCARRRSRRRRRRRRSPAWRACGSGG